jgi:putative membrane protein
MIPEYSNHAANERTFLAWVRTGIAIIALGFVIEKFNLFLVTVARTVVLEGQPLAELQKLSGPLGRWGGYPLVVGGVALIVLATWRFLRTERQLLSKEAYPASVVRTEFVLLTVCLLFVAGFSAYVALG